jgi:hypothetical protein
VCTIPYPVTRPTSAHRTDICQHGPGVKQANHRRAATQNDYTRPSPGKESQAGQKPLAVACNPQPNNTTHTHTHTHTHTDRDAGGARGTYTLRGTWAPAWSWLWCNTLLCAGPRPLLACAHHWSDPPYFTCNRQVLFMNCLPKETKTRRYPGQPLIGQDMNLAHFDTPPDHTVWLAPTLLMC